MDALLKDARGAMRAYLAALEDDTAPLIDFTRRYVRASEACSAAGLTLSQMRLQMLKGGAN